MNWEKVKGFCRRQTQKINENYRHAEFTKDEESEVAVKRVKMYRKVAGTCASRFEKVSANIADTIAMLESIKEDLRLIEVEDINATATKLELACLAMRKQHEVLSATINLEAGKLRRFFDECAGVDQIVEDRRAKKLEFDFFRNKVADLKRHPPSDPARIPRNEARVDEWQRAYDDANDRLKNLTHKLTLQGVRSISDAATGSATGVTKHYSECSQTWRTLFGNAGVPAAVLSGVQAMAAGQLPKMPSVPQPPLTSPTSFVAAQSRTGGSNGPAQPQQQPPPPSSAPPQQQAAALQPAYQGNPPAQLGTDTAQQASAQTSSQASPYSPATGSVDPQRAPARVKHEQDDPFRM
jgi:hypothetical protein